MKKRPASRGPSLLRIAVITMPPWRPQMRRCVRPRPLLLPFQPMSSHRRSRLKSSASVRPNGTKFVGTQLGNERHSIHIGKRVRAQHFACRGPWRRPRAQDQLADEFDAEHPAAAPNHFAGLALLVFPNKRKFEVSRNRCGSIRDDLGSPLRNVHDSTFR
jgi:hypothetical protein